MLDWARKIRQLLTFSNVRDKFPLVVTGFCGFFQIPGHVLCPNVLICLRFAGDCLFPSAIHGRNRLVFVLEYCRQLVIETQNYRSWSGLQVHGTKIGRHVRK